jgi:hypothetical protein
MKPSDQEDDAPQNQFVHRLIPTVTAVGLTLGAGACGGSDDPDDNGISKDELQNYCSDLRSCVGEDDFGYDSLDGCVSYFDEQVRYYTQIAQEEVGEACADAMLGYFDCILDSNSCNMGEFEYTEGSCEAEIYAYSDACYDDMSGSM